MNNYKQIIADIVEAIEPIKESVLKEYAFQELLKNALTQAIPYKENHSLPEKPSDVSSHSTSKKRTKSGNSSIKASSVRDVVKQAFDDVTAVFAGQKPLNELKQQWEKCLWVLNIAKNKGVDSMTNAEIAYILQERFSFPIPEKTVNNLTFKAKQGYVIKTNLDDGVRAWKISVHGIEIVKDASK